MRPWFVVICSAVLLSGGCTGGKSASSASAGGSEPDGDAVEPQEVKIVAVDYAFPEAPTEIRGGVIDLTFVNRGTVRHEVALAGIGETPMDQFVDGLRAGAFQLNGKPSPEYLDQVAVPIFGLEGGATGGATFTLTAGRYALFCVITDAAKGDEEKPHYEVGMLRDLTVTGGEPEPKLPEAEGTITAIDYGFEFDLEAGDRVVNFVNEGPDQIHYTSVEMYPEGVDAVEAEEAYATLLEPGASPEGIPSPKGVGFSGIFSDGLGSRFQLDRPFQFESGRTHVFACFVQDREGGEPHAIAYDMYEAVTIE